MEIEDENIGKIFTPFFSTKSSITNWGIGLAFCYRVIEVHDGKLTVESQVGEGTTFSIALPIIYYLFIIPFSFSRFMDFLISTSDTQKHLRATWFFSKYFFKINQGTVIFFPKIETFS